jgi:hypothetical protein
MWLRAHSRAACCRQLNACTNQAMRSAAPVVLSHLPCKAVLDHATPVLTAPPPSHTPSYATAHVVGCSPIHRCKALQGCKQHCKAGASSNTSTFFNSPCHVVCWPTPVVARLGRVQAAGLGRLLGWWRRRQARRRQLLFYQVQEHADHIAQAALQTAQARQKQQA